MKKYIIANEETGELIEFETLTSKEKVKLSKKLVDNMLLKSKTIEDIDISLLYSWLKTTKFINEFGQIKLVGNYINFDFFKLSREDVLIFGYTCRLIECMNGFTNILMKNHQTPFRNWKEIYINLGVTSKTTQTKLKKFCEVYDLVRVDKTLRTKQSNKFITRYIVNPFIIRKSAYISQISLARFQDCAKEGVNINFYAYLFLQCTGIFEIEK